MGWGAHCDLHCMLFCCRQLSCLSARHRQKGVIWVLS